MMHSELNMFMCPKTQQPLRIDWQHHEATSAQGDVSYPIVDGILDFVGHDRHVVRESYDRVAGVYDQFLSSPTPLTKLYNALVWGLDDREYVTPLLDGFPEPMGGECIIDIPVGTGVFTADVYARLCRRATIIVMDYSMGMLQQARTCYEARGIDNIIYACADVGNLPLVDGCGDVLLTMNGYHAFPEKQRALAELVRILKPNATVLGCFYVKHERWFTDLFIRHVYTRQRTFTPPFQTIAEINAIWGRYFEFSAVQHIKSIVCFQGQKKRIERPGTPSARNHNN